MSLDQTEVVRRLAQVPLFGLLSDADRAAIAAHVTEQECASEEAIVREGDPGDAMFVVVSGRVVVAKEQDGARNVVSMLEQGQAFGELSLFDGEPRSASVTAVEPATVLRLERDAFLELVRRNPDLTLALLRLLAQRLRTTTTLYTTV